MIFAALITAEVRQRMLQVAREFRKEPTPSEAILWSALRRKQLDGHKFRRQQPIGTFVVDFYCDDAALVIEVDGPIHRYRTAADLERQRILEALDLRVVRVPSNQVETNLDGVVARIRNEIRPLPGRLAAPLPQGEGIKGRGKSSASEGAICG